MKQYGYVHVNNISVLPPVCASAYPNIITQGIPNSSHDFVHKKLINFCVKTFSSQNITST